MPNYPDPFQRFYEQAEAEYLRRRMDKWDIPSHLNAWGLIRSEMDCMRDLIGLRVTPSDSAAWGKRLTTIAALCARAAEALGYLGHPPRPPLNGG